MKKLTVNHFVMCMAVCCLLLTSCSKTDEYLIPSEGPAITKSTDTTGLVPEEDYYYVGSWEGAGVGVDFNYYSYNSNPPALGNPTVTIVDPLTATSIKSIDGLTYWGSYPVGNGLYQHSFTIGISLRANYGSIPLFGVYRFTFSGFGYFDMKFLQDEWNG